MKISATGRPRIDWQAERERIDLAAVGTRLLGPASGRRGESGRKLWWCCPFHEDRNPSFCIDPGKAWWKCFGCGESGDAASLVMRLESITFPEAVAYLTGGPEATRARGPRKAPVNTPPKPPPEPSGLPEADALALVEDAAARLWTPEGADALAYLTGPERCLSLASIKAARLGWTPRADGVAWKPPGVVIPWYVGPRLALVKVRPPEAWRERFPKERRPPKYLEAFRDPARLVCYPDPATIRPGRPLMVTEGEFDALALGEALGELAAVVTLGSASAEPSPAIIGRFLAANPWFVATDADPAGDKAAAKWDAYPRARRVRPPAPYKDWTEARQAGVNVVRWWRDILNGNPSPELFTDDEAAGWRWGPSVDEESPGIFVVTEARNGRENQ
ncbi:MAG: dnaG 2 [Planctomycetota bacterium]|nr:dnaG 2 [Planctomycetota bacterium]